jgi:hypothetical protein
MTSGLGNSGFNPYLRVRLIGNRFPSDREVAQAGSAPGLGPGGRRFESCLPDEQEARSESCGFCFFGSRESLLSKADGKTKRSRRSRDGAFWVIRRARGSREIRGSGRAQSCLLDFLTFSIRSKPVNNRYLQAFFISCLSNNIRKKQISGELSGELSPAQTVFGADRRGDTA